MKRRIPSDVMFGKKKFKNTDALNNENDPELAVDGLTEACGVKTLALKCRNRHLYR